MNFKIEEIKEKVNNAVNLLLKNDLFLLDKNVNERSISHKLAEYLQQQFPEYRVDCEYNRMRGENSDEDFLDYVTKTLVLEIKDIKTDDVEAKTVYPDIIVHHRGTNNNLLVIEVKKKDNNASKAFDIKKLKGFIKERLGYTFGLYIEFETNGEVNTEWFPNDPKSDK